METTPAVEKLGNRPDGKRFSLVEDGLDEKAYRDVLDDVYSNMGGERKREMDREAGAEFLAIDH